MNRTLAEILSKAPPPPPIVRRKIEDVRVTSQETYVRMLEVHVALNDPWNRPLKGHS